jgi:diguanylate cyclase (GGDEF)-like protein
VVSDRRRPGSQTALVFCDVDDMQRINDDLGHAVGDEVLRTIADRIAAAVRRGDSVARIGGDELLVVLPGIHTEDEALILAERILQAARASIGVARGLPATVSIGVTLLQPGEYPDDVIARADRAMRRAKAAGGDRICAD